MPQKSEPPVLPGIPSLCPELSWAAKLPLLSSVLTQEPEHCILEDIYIQNSAPHGVPLYSTFHLMATVAHTSKPQTFPTGSAVSSETLLPFPSYAEPQPSARFLLDLYRENLQVFLILVMCFIPVNHQLHLVGRLPERGDGFLVAGAAQIDPVHLQGSVFAFQMTRINDLLITPCPWGTAHICHFNTPWCSLMECSHFLWSVSSELCATAWSKSQHPEHLGLEVLGVLPFFLTSSLWNLKQCFFLHLHKVGRAPLSSLGISVLRSLLPFHHRDENRRNQKHQQINGHRESQDALNGDFPFFPIDGTPDHFWSSQLHFSYHDLRRFQHFSKVRQNKKFCLNVPLKKSYCNVKLNLILSSLIHQCPLRCLPIFCQLNHLLFLHTKTYQYLDIFEVSLGSSMNCNRITTNVNPLP